MPTAADKQHGWYIVDAEGQTLGRLASRIAAVLRGKNKATFTPHMDMGDYVIVINASKIRVSGAKESQKQYYRHSGYPGGFRSTVFSDMLAKHPERIIEEAVRGMLPHTNLGRDQMKKLKVFAGAEHPHQAQKPVTLEITA
jgi:large subunit ribosomal protein L13